MIDLKKINTLVVWLQNYRVGTINRLAGDRYLFSFEQAYIDDPKRPILSLSFKGQTSSIISSTRVYNLRLPPFFSNVLPEGHLRSYLAEKVGVKPEREFFLLAALGADLPGAITATPLEVNSADQNIFSLHNSDQDEQVLRFSLAGVQLKFSAVMETSGGLTIPANGIGGSWIVKLPSARFSAVPENEFVMLALARAIGITIPQNRLIDIKEIRGLPEDTLHLTGKALAIERFDRGVNGERIHMEDFAQIFGLFPDDKYKNKSYANIANVLWVESGETDTYEFVRRLVFSILIGNADMHLKNWSVLYLDGHAPTLSPAYDFVATLPYIRNDELALSFGGARSLKEISPDQLRHFADTAKLPVNPIAQLLDETIDRTVDAWKNLEEKYLLTNEMQQVIDQQIESVALNTQRQF